MQHQRLDPKGLAKPSETCGTGPGLDRHDAEGWLLTVLEPNQTVFLVQTCTAGGLPGPVANTSHPHEWNCKSIWLAVRVEPKFPPHCCTAPRSIFLLSTSDALSTCQVLDGRPLSRNCLYSGGNILVSRIGFYTGCHSR